MLTGPSARSIILRRVTAFGKRPPCRLANQNREGVQAFEKKLIDLISTKMRFFYLHDTLGLIDGRRMAS